YDSFIKEVKDMYPGWEGDCRYTVADLQAVAQKHANEPMTWHDEFSAYDRAFHKVMQQLMNKGIVGTAERDRIFLEGLPSDIQMQTCTRLLIKFPDHHPQDPYPLKDVRAAALFLLPESPPPPQSASDDSRIIANHYAALRCICASTVGGCILTCVLDQGAEVVVMPKDVWQSLGVGLHSDHHLSMESVNTTHDSTLGVIENIFLDFGSGPMFFQAQVTERANFEILLGCPFFTLTSCRTFDLPDGEQNIVITDPNTGKEMRIPTLPWVKNCQSATHGALKRRDNSQPVKDKLRSYRA
ncbi:hypothetical protein P692DRAFT_201710279, partial [Suillus brevipes Sb2]